MPLYEGGPLTQFTAFNAGVIPNDVFGVAINWFVNRTPLVSRLPKLPSRLAAVPGDQRQLPASLQPDEQRRRPGRRCDLGGGERRDRSSTSAT